MSPPLAARRPTLALLTAVLLLGLSQAVLASSPRPGTVIASSHHTETFAGVGTFTITVPSQKAYQETYTALSHYATDAANWATRSDVQAPTGSFLATLGMIFNPKNIPTLVQGFRDVWHASSVLQSGQNLESAAARRRFYQGLGFYKKYSPEQIALLNAVVFPAVKVARIAGTLYGGIEVTAMGIGGFFTHLSSPQAALSQAVLGVRSLFESWRTVSQAMAARSSGKRLPPSKALNLALLGTAARSLWAEDRSLLGVNDVYGMAELAGLTGRLPILTEPFQAGSLGAPLSPWVSVGGSRVSVPNIPGFMSLPIRLWADQTTHLVNLLNAWQIPLKEPSPIVIPPVSIPPPSNTVTTETITVTESLMPTGNP